MHIPISGKNRIKKICGIYNIFADRLYTVVETAGKLLFIIMVGAVSAAVFGRFVLRATPQWSEETGIICMVWLCFLSAALAVRDGSHIRMTVISYIFSAKACKVFHFASYVLIFILNVIWMVYGGEIIELTVKTRMPSTGFPMAVLFGSVGISGGIGALLSLARLTRGNW